MLVCFTLSEIWALNGLCHLQFLISEPPRLDRTFSDLKSPGLLNYLRAGSTEPLQSFPYKWGKTTTLLLPAATKTSPLSPLDLQFTSCPNVVKMFRISWVQISPKISLVTSCFAKLQKYVKFVATLLPNREDSVHCWLILTKTTLIFRSNINFSYDFIKAENSKLRCDRLYR